MDSTAKLFNEGYDCSFLDLKKDHESRPLWISPEGIIFLEAFSPIAEQAQDFLIAIAEPISRPKFIHEYRLTAYSLYAAVSIGLETKDILDVLQRLSKTIISDSIVKFITENTSSFGKIKLVLKENKYYVESAFKDILLLLLKDEEISQYVVKDTEIRKTDKSDNEISQLYNKLIGMDEEIGDDDENSFSFEIISQHVEDVRRRCNQIDYPMIEEYDFRNDSTLPSLNIDLKPTTLIRPYQEKSLGKMFGNGRARSGIIVLPCGAGKTLVGITAACTIRKSTLVLCTSAVSVEQWRSQFKSWSTISDKDIARFTSEGKEQFSGDAGIIVSTYTMVAYSGKRSYEAQKMMDFITSIEWGFLLLDEVHVVPANVFRKVLTSVAAHTKLGLTATLVREDEKIT
jgi:DNA excision repair protein ERCC-3